MGIIPSHLIQISTQNENTFHDARSCHVMHASKTETPHTIIFITQSLQKNRYIHTLSLLYCSPNTPARPRSISPTPIPSAPTRALTSRSRSSSRLLAVLRMRSATRSAVLRYCSILCTPSAKRSMCGSRDWLSLLRCACSAVGLVNVNADDGGRSAF
jgi:hypothetical protein